MKAIKLTEIEWHRTIQQISKCHPPSVLMIRRKMREVLGFTQRKHRSSSGVEIHLDFYDEPKRTMFLLKYGDWIRQEDENR